MSNESTQLPVGVNNRSTTHRTLTAFVHKWLARTRDALVYSSAYLCLVAIIEVVTVLLTLSLPASPALLEAGLITFAVYVGDRITDVDTDAATDPEQASFVQRHEQALSVLSASCYGLGVAISVLGGPLALGLTLLPGGLWIVYATEYLPSIGTRFRRLKNVLLVNTTIVSLAWATALVFLPVAFAGVPVGPVAAVMFGYFFLDTFVNTEIPNVHDVDGDAAIGVSTLPVVIGVARTRRVLYGVDVACAALVGTASALGLLSTALTVGLAVGLAYGLAITALVGRSEHERRLSIAREMKPVLVVAVVLVSIAA